jgi:Ca2+-binding EF-hand superfamily protein
MEFNDRQAKDSKTALRQNMAKLQREIVKNAQATEDSEFWGAMGVQGFRTYLIKKFGSVVAGWRVLDKDGNGHLSFYEFCNACRQMGFHGNLKLLWKQLDANDSHSVSRMEIDPEVGHYVGTFKQACLQKYGDTLTAWRKCIDTNGSGKVEEEEIVQACQKLGLDLDGKKLFSMISTFGLGLSLMEFDPEAWTRWVTGDIHGLTLRRNKEFVEDISDGEGASDKEKAAKDGQPGFVQTGGLAKYRQMIQKEEKAELKRQLDKIGQMKSGLHTAKGFKLALVHRCGSLYGAWRYYLDLDGNGRLTPGEFSCALHRLGMFGEIRSLWKQLVPEVDGVPLGYLSFGDLDPKTDAAVTELRDKLTEKYGNMLRAWMKGMDTKGSGCVNEKAFVQICEKVGYSGDARKLFRVMQPAQGRTYLTLRDFDTAAYQALSRADFRMLSEPEQQSDHNKSQLEMTFDERQQAGFYYQIRRAWDTAHREEFAKACQYNLKEFAIDTSEEFEMLCKRKYGSMVGAWRQCLDSDHNGKLTFNEFCAALRRLGYVGDMRKLWKRYDKDQKGCILLKDLDPEADQILSSFLELLAKKYGDLDTAWIDGFHKSTHDSVDEGLLAQACKKMGWDGDAHKLFKCFQPAPGRQLITIWDLDPSVARSKQQGKATNLSNMAPPSPLKMQRFGTLKQEASVAMPGDTSDHDKMRTLLKKKYGSTAAAWREMDSKVIGSVSFGIFVKVLDEGAFYGNVKTLWHELTGYRPGEAGGKGVTYDDIDHSSARLLNDFREQLVQKYGCLLKAWKEAFGNQATRSPPG